MATARPSGRPRDPDVDRKLAEAAVALFGEQGWASFTIEAVCRRAEVGKASAYLRWNSKEELLTEALTTRLGSISDVDTGSVRGDLVQLVWQMTELYGGENGRAALRLLMEAENIPGLAERYTELAQAQIMAARAIVLRGKHRGELPEGTSVTYLLDALCGGAMNHALTTRLAPPELRDSAPPAADYAERFVDFVLTSVFSREGAA
ncbi:AcrR family transcriptional regulator [Lipingzhangella halophila]|uniref:AcrR family transcriptional regulator n=1 Tax=Lipingzhangella halophila TaxID=1783352 RepID=A0A7W7RK03_9ACTN|nr:TetR/AcrR family transcriptional regulator [Lipingzhangella halophila]MBB4932963.1 AcrR family transcriptional regulator [Lipingzhangella halophila]